MPSALNVNRLTNSVQLVKPEKRAPKGFWISPYPLLCALRYFLNLLTNGFFSYKNPDRASMKLLAEKTIRNLGTDTQNKSVNIAFLGDVMVSKSGKLPNLTVEMKKLLEESDIIIANVEAPVTKSESVAGRGASLDFEMSSTYLKALYDCNPDAKWVFSVANNHACDAKKGQKEGQTVVDETVAAIKEKMPNAEVIGAESKDSDSMLSLQIDHGPRIGIIGWTEVMNNDHKHARELSGKQIIRDTDLDKAVLEQIKKDNNVDLLIGFPHANEEQSYYPLKETRDRWINWMGKDKFDVIVGHGPHVVHPAEEVGDGVIFHSIGNFCSPKGPSQTKVGCVPQISLGIADKKIVSMTSTANFTQQAENGVSLVRPLGSRITSAPANFPRIQKIWPKIFR